MTLTRPGTGRPGLVSRHRQGNQRFKERKPAYTWLGNGFYGLAATDRRADGGDS